jgi:hypothetical protein
MEPFCFAPLGPTRWHGVHPSMVPRVLRCFPRRGDRRGAHMQTCSHSRASIMPARAGPAHAWEAIGTPRDSRGEAGRRGPPCQGPTAHRWAPCPWVGTSGSGHARGLLGIGVYGVLTRPVSSNGAENWVPASSFLDIFSLQVKDRRYMDERDAAFTGVARLL